MRIIEELEPTERSVYTGAIGWVFKDHVRLAMAIRTALCFEGTAVYPVGGGIVADSDPEAEWDETQTKAKPFLQALGFGGDVGLDLA
jgi:anthranilate/para-aminobenzoate synthase component I